MWKKLIKKLRGNEKGITGLETAINLIAFVIVASVFAYVVLSAASVLFAEDQGSHERRPAVHHEYVEIKANVVAKMENSVVTHILIGVGIPAAAIRWISVRSTAPPCSWYLYSDVNSIVPSCTWTVSSCCTII
jgi:flagellin-like protein